jgi:hypothetical protein
MFSTKNDILPFTYANKSQTNQRQGGLSMPLSTNFSTYIYSALLLFISFLLFLASLAKLPFILFNPQSFILIFSLFCLTFHASFAVLHGVYNYILFFFGSQRVIVAISFSVSTILSFIFAQRSLYVPCLISIFSQFIIFAISLVTYFSASAGLTVLKTVFSGIRTRISPF